MASLCGWLLQAAQRAGAQQLPEVRYLKVPHTWHHRHLVIQWAMAVPSPKRSGSQPWVGAGATKEGVIPWVLSLSHPGGGCVSQFRLSQQKVIDCGSTTHFFLTVQEAGHPRSGCWWGYRLLSLLISSQGRGKRTERKPLSVTLIRVQISFMSVSTHDLVEC